MVRLIDVERVSKSFESVRALRDVSLSVDAGSVCGLIGSNGAGKTTLLSLLVGLEQPDRGVVRLLEKDPRYAIDSPLAAVGVQLDQYGVFPTLSALDFVRYVGCLYGVDAGVAKDRAYDLLDALGLDGETSRRVGDLSLGNRKKVSFAAALVHRPAVLIVDEPMESLDPWSQYLVGEIITQCARRGAAVLMSSHNLAAVEKLCDHIVLLAGGQVQYAGATQELPAHQNLEKFCLEALGQGDPENDPLERISWL